MTPQQVDFLSHQQGYVTIPLNQIQQGVALSGGVTYPTLPSQATFDTHAQAGDSFSPLEKDSFVDFDYDNSNVDCSKYQRFH